MASNSNLITEQGVLQKMACRYCGGRGFMQNYPPESKRHLPIDDVRCGLCNGWGFVYRRGDKNDEPARVTSFAANHEPSQE